MHQTSLFFSESVSHSNPIMVSGHTFSSCKLSRLSNESAENFPKDSLDIFFNEGLKKTDVAFRITWAAEFLAACIAPITEIVGIFIIDVRCRNVSSDLFKTICFSSVDSVLLLLSPELKEDKVKYSSFFEETVSPKSNPIITLSTVLFFLFNDIEFSSSSFNFIPTSVCNFCSVKTGLKCSDTGFAVRRDLCSPALRGSISLKDLFSKIQLSPCFSFFNIPISQKDPCCEILFPKDFFVLRGSLGGSETKFNDDITTGEANDVILTELVGDPECTPKLETF
ncbi:unnamed protein product [Pneumocystis jirovecii]|uniref:Uncharacterized protein n=1 Tax=Pneumocystis jirovecii TaxID=42068 RepID=L0PBV0_PNEJI|nr:unnamed protein product [Pneumocystis jirovecii]